MPAKSRLVYWDSCVFIDYVQKNPHRIETLDAIIEEARQRKYTIVTSTLSVAEVVFGEGESNPKPLDPMELAAINDMWRDRSIIEVVEFHLVIAEEARDLVRRGRVEGRLLKPLDAIHLVTARSRDVADFHTYDNQLLGWDSEWFPIRNPAPIAHQMQLPET